MIRTKVFVFMLVFFLAGCAISLPHVSRSGHRDSPAKTASMHLFEKGKEAFLRGDYVTAEKNFRQSISLFSFNPYSYYFLGRIRATENKYDEAVSLFHKSLLYLKDDPEGKAETFYRLGMALSAKGDKEEAREQFIRALKLDADHSGAKKALERLK